MRTAHKRGIRGASRREPDGVLLGHHHPRASVVRRAQRVVELALREAMVIREDALSDHFGAEVGERPPERARAGEAGDGEHPGATQRAAPEAPRERSVDDVHGRVARLHRRAAGRLAREGSQRFQRGSVRLIHAGEPHEPGAGERRARLAVRAARQEVAVAERVRGVEHDHVEIAGEGAVLEPVVEDQRVGAERRDRHRRERGATRPTEHRDPGEPAREERRLVARLVAAEQHPHAVRDNPRVPP